MKILIANYRFFISGGPERYMFNVIESLKKRGHEVVPFSINYTRNLPTPYSHYFVEPLGGRDEILYHEQRKTIQALVRTLKRLFYAQDVAHAVTRIIQETQPQIAFVLHYLRKLSPSLLIGLKRAGLPIAVRLSDYAMLCPQSHCFRDGRPCELCIQGNLWPSIRYRCVQQSLIASMLNALATWYHRSRQYFDLIDVFITSNKFMYNMMRSAGYPERRLKCIPTFVDTEFFHPKSEISERGVPYISYVGRLEHIKGVHILVDAWKQLKQLRPNVQAKLKIAGFGDNEYEKRLENMCLALGLDDVEFIGRLDKEGTAKLLRESYISVVPSLWYENLPNVLLESYSSGTPVLASDIGTLKESVVDGETGYLFEAGNSEQLARRLFFCLINCEKISLMSKKARRTALARHSPERHLSELESLFLDLVR